MPEHAPDSTGFSVGTPGLIRLALAFHPLALIILQQDPGSVRFLSIAHPETAHTDTPAARWRLVEAHIMGIEQGPYFIGFVIRNVAQIHQMVGHTGSLAGTGQGNADILAPTTNRPNLQPEPFMTEKPLRLLLDFDACAQRDKGQAQAFLHRRDRKFALICEQQGVMPRPERWMAHMNHLSGPGAGTSAAEQTLRFWRRIDRGFMLAGTLLGLLTMLGLLFYDGGQRINVTVILAFVAFQLLLALLTTAQSLVGWQPWRRLLRRFRNNPESAISTKLQPVLMARAAQLGGLCFAFAGLATLLVMVVLQDLAFGWSTTLETDASSYYRMISAIAAPWAWLLPAAAPDSALVEATRFFRATTGEGNVDPALWGQWWPFIAMLWTTWALLPRLVLSILAGLLIRRKARHLLASHPALRALMYRMETPVLETGNEYNDASDLPGTDTGLGLQPLPDSRIVLCWAGAGDPELPDTLSTGKSLIANAGGRMTLAEDRQALEQVATQLAQNPGLPVLLVTRSWEPPTGELEDFLASARKLWPEGTKVVLVPQTNHTELEPDTPQVQQWLRFAGRAGPDFVTVSLVPTQRAAPDMEGGIIE